MFKLQGRKFCLHNMCGQQRNSPMADPIFGSKYGPQNGVQNWITFSFLLLGLCLGPVLGSRFGSKSGVSNRRILLLPAEVLHADLRRSSMSASVNTCFFSLCVPLCFLYSNIIRRGPQAGGPQGSGHHPPESPSCSATPNRDKTIHCKRKRRKKHPASNVAAESAPHPRHAAKACDNNTQTIPNNKCFGKDGQHAGGAGGGLLKPC